MKKKIEHLWLMTYVLLGLLIFIFCNACGDTTEVQPLPEISCPAVPACPAIPTCPDQRVEVRPYIYEGDFRSSFTEGNDYDIEVNIEIDENSAPIVKLEVFIDDERVYSRAMAVQ